MPGPMEGAARTRLVALVVLLAVAVPLGVVAAAGSGGGDDAEESTLRVERSPELPEVLVYVEPDANTPERARGQTVRVECVDSGGGVIAGQVEQWPFTDTDQGTLDPHTHVPVNPDRIGDLERCRLRGTKPLLAAPLS